MLSELDLALDLARKLEAHYEENGTKTEAGAHRILTSHLESIKRFYEPTIRSNK